MRPMRIPDIAPARAVRWFLVLAALAAGGFYFALHRIDNGMPPVDPAAYADPPSGLAWGTERCWSNGKKLVASGWVARRGHGVSRRRVRVVFTDAEGRLRAVSTSLRQRDEVSAALNRRFGDDVDYPHAGFTASLDDPPPGAAGADGGVYLAYEDDEMRALLPLDCPAGAP